jgi:hypothetical protein
VLPSHQLRYDLRYSGLPELLRLIPRNSTKQTTHSNNEQLQFINMSQQLKNEIPHRGAGRETNHRLNFIYRLRHKTWDSEEIRLRIDELAAKAIEIASHVE